MAYQSWSVVFGEQPSAAKWNILGTNDASFNDGTGIGDSAITPAKLLTGTGSSWAWASYTPTLSATAGSPTIGNGTITGAYSQIGKSVFAKIKITAGSTTNFGTTKMTLTLPVTANESTDAYNMVGTWGGLDISGGVATGGLAVINSTTTLSFLYHSITNVGQQANFVADTTPINTMSDTGDTFHCHVFYEAA